MLYCDIFYVGGYILHPLFDLFTFFLHMFDSILDNLKLPCSSGQKYAGVPPDLITMVA